MQHFSHATHKLIKICATQVDYDGHFCWVSGMQPEVGPIPAWKAAFLPKYLFLSRVASPGQVTLRFRRSRLHCTTRPRRVARLVSSSIGNGNRPKFRNPHECLNLCIWRNLISSFRIHFEGTSDIGNQIIDQNQHVHCITDLTRPLHSFFRLKCGPI